MVAPGVPLGVLATGGISSFVTLLLRHEPMWTWAIHFLMSDLQEWGYTMNSLPSPRALRKEWRRRSLQCHPDKGGSEGVEPVLQQAAGPGPCTRRRRCWWSVAMPERPLCTTILGPAVVAMRWSFDMIKTPTKPQTLSPQTL